MNTPTLVSRYLARGALLTDRVAGGMLPSRPILHHPLDTPSWRFNTSVRVQDCAAAWQQCGACCRDHAAHAGLGVGALRRSLTSAALRTSLHISVLGNSVARFHDFAVTRAFVQQLQSRAPKTRVTVGYAHVAGGFEPDHLFYCGLNSSSLLQADLVLVHYHAPRGGVIYERVLRRLLTLPRRPAVVYVAHCTMSDFSAYRDWALARDRGPWGFRAAGEDQGYFEAQRRLERRLVREHYGLSFISTCDAFETMLGRVDQSDRLNDDSYEDSARGWLTRMGRRYLPYSLARMLGGARTDSLGTWNASSACASSGPAFSRVTDLLPIFYPPNDHLHLSRSGAALQGCLVSHAVLDASVPPEGRSASMATGVLSRARRGVAAGSVAAGGVAAGLPPLLLSAGEAALLCGTGGGKGGRCTEDDSSGEPSFCLTAREGALEPANQSSGWQAVRKGGVGGSKAFLFAMTPGAQLRVLTPQPATAFLIEVYRHHERALAALHVEIPGSSAPPRQIEPCCPHPGCPGLPIGRGKYELFRVPAVGFLPHPTRELHISVLAHRGAGSTGGCAREGWEASVAGVIGLVRGGESSRVPPAGGGARRPRREAGLSQLSLPIEPLSTPPSTLSLEEEIAGAIHEMGGLSQAQTAAPSSVGSSAHKLWRYLHEGSTLCDATTPQGSIDIYTKPAVTSRCHPAHAKKSTVVFAGAGMGLTNQLMTASQALHEACRTRSNFAGAWHPNGFGTSSNESRDLIELFEVGVLHQRLRNGSDALRRLYKPCPSSAKLEVEPVDCSATQLVPIRCVGQHGKGGSHQRAWTLMPKRPQMLFAMEPNHRLPWHHTLCSFSLASGSFNAIHFNIDADWLLFICADFSTFGKSATGQLPQAERASLLSANGLYAPFVRRVVIPQFIRAMRLSFVHPNLPVVVCSSLGKLFHVTLWIADELEQAVRASFGVPIILGTAGNTERELNALADLRVLVRAETAVLWPGSSFSELAALHRVARNASFGWVADLRSSHLCKMTTNASNERHSAPMPGMMMQTGPQLLGLVQPKGLRPVTGRAATSPCLTYLH